MASSSTPPQTFDPDSIIPPGLKPPEPYPFYHDRDIVGRALSAKDDTLMWKLFEKWLRKARRYYRNNKIEKEVRFKIFKDYVKRVYACNFEVSWTGIPIHGLPDFTLQEKNKLSFYYMQPYRAYNDLAVLHHALSADDNALMKKLFKEWTMDYWKRLTKKEKKQHFKTFKASAKKICEIPWAGLNVDRSADWTEERDEMCPSSYEDGEAVETPNSKRHSKKRKREPNEKSQTEALDREADEMMQIEA